VIALIDDLFMLVLRVPTPLLSPSNAASSSSDLWHASVMQQVQLVCLQVRVCGVFDCVFSLVDATACAQAGVDLRDRVASHRASNARR
jgi:hypothetical protein